MDEKCSRAVREVFVNLYNKGLIYHGNRIINWCPECRTALSDAEVEYVDENSFFWHIKYFIEGSDTEGTDRRHHPSRNDVRRYRRGGKPRRRAV